LYDKDAALRNCRMSWSAFLLRLARVLLVNNTTDAMVVQTPTIAKHSDSNLIFVANWYLGLQGAAN